MQASPPPPLLAWTTERVSHCPSCLGAERRRAQTVYRNLQNLSSHFWQPEQRGFLDALKISLIGNTTRYPRRNLQGDTEATCMWDCYRRATMLEPLAAAVLQSDGTGCDGDFMETGVYRGGISIFMAGMLAAAGELGEGRRCMWVADSFAGLPDPREYTQLWARRREHRPPLPPHAIAALAHNHSQRVRELVKRDRDGRGFSKGLLGSTLEEVQSNFRRHLGRSGSIPGHGAVGRGTVGVLDGVRFLKGYFADTLPGPVGRLALLRIDSDMYASIHETLEALYPRLSIGGFVVFDDWKLAQARAAILDYRAEHNVSSPIVSSSIYDVRDQEPFHTLDRIAFWRKSADGG